MQIVLSTLRRMQEKEGNFAHAEVHEGAGLRTDELAVKADVVDEHAEEIGQDACVEVNVHGRALAGGPHVARLLPR